MQFSEHELTLALTGAAKSVAATRGKRRFRRGPDPEESWQQLTGYERYQVLDGISDQVLPVLAALPEVEVPSGHRPEFSNAQVLAAIEEALGPDQGAVRGKVTTAARLALVRTALAHLPPRTDRQGPSAG
jgi:hypothetical protein